MNKRQIKKKQKNIDKWWEGFSGAVYGYRDNRLMNRVYHEFCIKQRHPLIEIRKHSFFEMRRLTFREEKNVYNKENCYTRDR